MILPLAIASFVLSANVISACISTGDGISYDELKQLNVSCPPKDTCAGRKPDVHPGITRRFCGFVRTPDFQDTTCSCHAECSSLGTCCIDSPHRGKSSASHKCGQVYYPGDPFTSGYYMVQQCPKKDVYKHLCEGDFSKDGDIQKIAPVTSLDTNTTYRNYYCFRCNEMTDNFLYWNLQLLGRHDGPDPQTDDFEVTYNDVDNTWSATVVADQAVFFCPISITVRLKFIIPQEIGFPVMECNHFVISDCPDSWEDDLIRSKCHSYMGLLYPLYSFTPYRNAHCALCNSQPLHELSCMEKVICFSKFFNFASLLKVSKPDRNSASKKVKCTDVEMRDPYVNKCRKLSCVVPGYVIKDGKCVPPIGVSFYESIRKLIV